MKKSILKETIIVFCLAVIIASTAAAIFSFIYNADIVEKNAGKLAYAGAALAADTVESVNYDELTKSESSDLYSQIRKEMKNICKDFGLEYLYIYEPEPETESARFIMTVASDDEEDKTVKAERGLGKVVKHKLTEQEKNILQGTDNKSARSEKNSYGNVYTWTCPIYQDGKIIALASCDYSTNILLSRTVVGSAVIILLMVCVLMIAMLIAVIAIRKKVLLPIKTLSESMNSFITDNGIDCSSIDICTDNEIEKMADAFMSMRRDIKGYIENIKVLTAARAREDAEFDIAQRIQNGIVPEKTAFSENTYDIFAVAKPTRNVGGDFYDCFVTKDGKLCLVTGDVSGKSISAAMFMVMTRTMIHDRMNNGYSPAAALNSVNHNLCVSNPEGMFATVFAAVFDPDNGELIFANAGHTEPVITGTNTRFAKIDSGIAIGLFDDSESDIKDDRMRLNDGEIIIIYTDGVTDIVNGNKEFFGKNRLLEAVRSSKNAKESITSLNKATMEFAKGEELFDDYTVLALHYKGNSTRISLAPTENSLSELKDTVLGIVGKTPNGKKIYLACEEVFINILTYSGTDTIEVELRKNNGTFVTVFTDSGVSFNPVSAETEKKDFYELQNGGMGLSLIKQIAENMYYKRDDNKNILTLKFSLETDGK